MQLSLTSIVPPQQVAGKEDPRLQRRHDLKNAVHRSVCIARLSPEMIQC
jgi:hypothetical protein